MNINYLKIEEELNAYAIETIYDIIEKCGKHMTQEQIETYENLICMNKVVIVNKPTIEDNEFFKGNVPVAHGPRTKKDGYIHVYPYKYKNMDTEQIIDVYINQGVLLHELYHYIIKLDIPNNGDTERVKFGHFITEGMVEFLTELHSKKQYHRWSKRRNVCLAEKMYNMLSERNNISCIYQENFETIFKFFPELEELFIEYQKENAIVNEITQIIEKLCKKINKDKNKLLAKFNRYPLCEGIEELKLFICNTLPPDEADELISEIDFHYNNAYKAKEKGLK